MAAKTKYVKVTLKKYRAFQELEKGRSTKDVTIKFNLPGISLHERRMKKNLWHI